MTELAGISVKRISAPSTNRASHLAECLLPYIQTLLISESSVSYYDLTLFLSLFILKLHSHMIFLFIPSKRNSFKPESNILY